MKRLKLNFAIPALIVVCLALFPLLGASVYYLSALFMVFLYASLACGWNILGGYTGYMNFGHAAFFGAGAYTTALLLINFGLSPFYTAIVAGLAAAALAAIVGYPTLRLRGPYFVLVTFCLGLAVRVVVVNMAWTGSSQGLWMPLLAVDIRTNRVIFYEVMLGILVLTVLVSMWIERSKYGLGLRSISEDEDSAETQGVNATALKMGAFIISAFLAGIAVSISMLVVLMALLGGRRSWIGPVMGASIVVVINEILTAHLGIGAEFSRVIYGLLLVVVIVYLPDGLLGLRIRRKAKDKVAQIDSPPC
jgi:branched-chain amino acid transport system permease protein